MTAYYRWHIITHTHCDDLLVRRKILRLYFSSNTNSNPYSSSLNHNAPACRDAISCVSRAMTAYHHRHIITHTHCDDLLVRRKILRLYFSSSTNSNPYSSSLNHNAPACRDAISCVSRAMTTYHHRHIITHTHCTYLLVRRKILRLYFCRLRYLIALKFPSAAYLMQSYTQSPLMPLQYYGYGLYFVERSEPVFLHLLKLRGRQSGLRLELRAEVRHARIA